MKKVKHFLHISDYGNEELWDILNLSKEVKARFRNREEMDNFIKKTLSQKYIERTSSSLVLNNVKEEYRTLL